MPRNAFYPISSVVLFLLFKENAVPLAGWLSLVAVVWASVALHEAGHVVAALCTGGRVWRVRVLPWHGVTSLDHAGPLSGACVSLAGPVAGILAAEVGLAVLMQSGAFAASATGAALRLILWTCVFDNLLNLIPAWKLDGRAFVRHMREWRSGRALRASGTAAPTRPAPRATVVAMLPRPRAGMTCRRSRTDGRGRTGHPHGARVCLKLGRQKELGAAAFDP